MSKAPSPLLGYNNNVRHKNRVFHIQTEDSGVKHPHVITHLFMDGGRILKSVKRSYAEHVGSDGLADVVRGMMKEQHKAMFIALRDGQFDHLVDAAEGGQVSRPVPPPPSSSATLPNAAPPSSGTTLPNAAPPKLSATLPNAAPPSSGTTLPNAAPPSSGDAAKKTASTATAAAVPTPSPAPKGVAPAKKSRSSRPPAPAGELTLDIDALERAAAAEQSGPLSSSLDPPPPANLLQQKKPDTGRYRNIPSRDAAPESSTKKPLPALVPPPTPAAARTATAPGLASPPAPPVRPAPPPPPKSKTVEKAPAVAAAGGDGRYAPARPAAIFGQARPQQGSSIFGEDLISDKSLDEVILSYLAEDLEADKK